MTSLDWRINLVNPNKSKAYCNKEKECGHKCKGVFGESECLPCLNSDCIKAALEASQEVEAKILASQELGTETIRKQPIVLESAAEHELCGICYTSELSEQTCVRLTCRHVFHTNCVK